MEKELFFDASKLPKAKNEYVCWLDVMGTRSIMSQSLEKCANFVCRLHVAVLKCTSSEMSLYPMLDGLYITSTTKDPLEKFLKEAFHKLANEFVCEENPRHKFIAKASVAYGPVIHGCDIPEEASYDLHHAPDHRNSLFFGMPIVQAYGSEAKAPPFGVFIHESARSFCPPEDRPIPFVWWQWCHPTSKIAEDLRTALEAYYKWCGANASTLLYDLGALERHEKLAKEYFHND